MIKLLDILQEAKAVGIIYHFTTLGAVSTMLEEYNSIILDDKYSRDEGKGYFSFTRNSKLETITLAPVRLKLDGNQMSNRYRFEPFMYGGRERQVSKIEVNWYEAEERINADRYRGKLNITPYIIDVTMSSEILELPENDIRILQYKRKFNDVYRWFTEHNIPVSLDN